MRAFTRFYRSPSDFVSSNASEHGMAIARIANALLAVATWKYSPGPSDQPPPTEKLNASPPQNTPYPLSFIGKERRILPAHVRQYGRVDLS